MSNPDNAATQTDNAQPDGKELSSEEKLAVAERRRKDTVGAFTKSQQANKALEAENAELLAQLAKVNPVSYSKEESENLAALKYSDPDAWMAKKQTIDAAKRGEAQAAINTATTEAKNKASASFEMARRSEVLADFNKSAPIAITDDVIANDVPGRITKKLENGEVTFEEFLNEVSTYVNTGKVVANEETLGQPNLGNAAGGTTPTDIKPEKSLSDSYANDLY